MMVFIVTNDRYYLFMQEQVFFFSAISGGVLGFLFQFPGFCFLSKIRDTYI
jgi:hypothetical protein